MVVWVCVSFRTVRINTLIPRPSPWKAIFCFFLLNETHGKTPGFFNANRITTDQPSLPFAVNVIFERSCSCEMGKLGCCLSMSNCVSEARILGVESNIGRRIASFKNFLRIPVMDGCV